MRKFNLVSVFDIVNLMMPDQEIEIIHTLDDNSIQALYVGQVRDFDLTREDIGDPMIHMVVMNDDYSQAITFYTGVYPEGMFDENGMINKIKE